MLRSHSFFFFPYFNKLTFMLSSFVLQLISIDLIPINKISLKNVWKILPSSIYCFNLEIVGEGDYIIKSSLCMLSSISKKCGSSYDMVVMLSFLSNKFSSMLTFRYKLLLNPSSSWWSFREEKKVYDFVWENKRKTICSSPLINLFRREGKDHFRLRFIVDKREIV